MIKLTSEAILAISLVKISLTLEFSFSRPKTMFFCFFLVFDNQDFFFKKYTYFRRGCGGEVWQSRGQHQATQQLAHW